MRDEELEEIPSLEGEEVGHWRLEEKLGEGGMSVVYHGRHKTQQLEGAVKLLHPELCRNRKVVQRFQQEAEAASQLDHENVIKLIDFGHEKDIGYYMVLELLDGYDLESLMEFAPFSKVRILPLAQQITSALAATHDAGIIHRDLNPSNIFLIPDPVNERHQVKLLDFGVAKVLERQNTTKLTSTGAIVGTPAYLAPEQITQKDVTTISVDIYALGVILYQVFTGKLPIEGETIIEHMMALLQQTPPPAGIHRPALKDTQLEAFFTRMLSKQPEERPTNMRQVWRELHAAASAFNDPLGPSRPIPTSEELKLEQEAQKLLDLDITPKQPPGGPSTEDVIKDMVDLTETDEINEKTAIEQAALPFTTRPTPATEAYPAFKDSHTGVRIEEMNIDTHDPIGEQAFGDYDHYEDDEEEEKTAIALAAPDSAHHPFTQQNIPASTQNILNIVGNEDPDHTLDPLPHGEGETINTFGPMSDPSHFDDQTEYNPHAQALQHPPNLGAYSDNTPAPSSISSLPTLTPEQANEYTPTPHPHPVGHRTPTPPPAIAPPAQDFSKTLPQPQAYVPPPGHSKHSFLANKWNILALSTLGLGVLAIVIVFFLPGPTKQVKKNTLLDQLYVEGEKAFKQNRYKDAIKQWKKVIQLPKWKESEYYPDLYKAIGVAFSRRNHLHSAVVYYKRYLKAGPKKPKEALHIKQVELPRFQRDLNRRLSKGNALVAQLRQLLLGKQWKKAHHTYQLALKLAPSMPQVQQQLAKEVSKFFPMVGLHLYRDIFYKLELGDEEKQQLSQKSKVLKKTLEQRIQELQSILRTTSSLLAQNKTRAAKRYLQKKLDPLEHLTLPITHKAFQKLISLATEKHIHLGITALKLYQQKRQALQTKGLSTWLSEGDKRASQQPQLQKQLDLLYKMKQYRALYRLARRALQEGSLTRANKYIHTARRLEAELDAKDHWKLTTHIQKDRTTLSRWSQRIGKTPTLQARAKQLKDKAYLGRSLQAYRTLLASLRGTPAYNTLAPTLNKTIQALRTQQTYLRGTHRLFKRRKWLTAYNRFNTFLKRFPRAHNAENIRYNMKICKCGLGMPWKFCKTQDVKKHLP